MAPENSEARKKAMAGQPGAVGA